MSVDSWRDYRSSTRQTIIKISSRLFAEYPRSMTNHVNRDERFVSLPRIAWARRSLAKSCRHWNETVCRWSVRLSAQLFTRCAFRSTIHWSRSASRTSHKPSEERMIRSSFWTGIRSNEEASSRVLKEKGKASMDGRWSGVIYFSWRKSGRPSRLSRAKSCLGPPP